MSDGWLTLARPSRLEWRRGEKDPGGSSRGFPRDMMIRAGISALALVAAGPTLGMRLPIRLSGGAWRWAEERKAITPLQQKKMIELGKNGKRSLHGTR